MAGTPVYMAPEVFHSQVYDSKADIYSLGLILWEIWYGKQAFHELKAPTFTAFFSHIDKGYRPKDVEGCKKPPDRWNALMEMCWNTDPEKRPSAEKCINETTAMYSESVKQL